MNKCKQYQTWWQKTEIPATQKAETGELQIQGQSGQLIKRERGERGKREGEEKGGEERVEKRKKILYSEDIAQNRQLAQHVHCSRSNLQYSEQTNRQVTL